MNKTDIKQDKTKFLKRALLGSGALFMLYMVILIIGNSIEHAIQQAVDWWPFLLIQTLGFGAQVGLFLHMRERHQTGEWRGPSSSLAIGGGVSAGSMVACCLHHVTDVLPIMGLSVLALSLTKYQSVFMSLGVLSNIVGLLYMADMMYRFSDFDLFGARVGRIVSSYDITRVRNISAFSSAIIFMILVVSAMWPVTGAQASIGGMRVNDLNGVTFTVEPVEYDGGLAFSIRIDTHSGSLDFDLKEITSLYVMGETVKPILWEGSPPGGHHRSGVLVFPSPSSASSEFSLVISGVNDVSERVFEWGSLTAATSSNIYTQGSLAIVITASIILALNSKKRSNISYEAIFEAEYQRFKESR